MKLLLASILVLFGGLALLVVFLSGLLSKDSALSESDPNAPSELSETES